MCNVSISVHASVSSCHPKRCRTRVCTGVGKYTKWDPGIDIMGVKLTYLKAIRFSSCYLSASPTQWMTTRGRYLSKIRASPIGGGFEKQEITSYCFIPPSKTASTAFFFFLFFLTICLIICLYRKKKHVSQNLYSPLFLTLHLNITTETSKVYLHHLVANKGRFHLGQNVVPLNFKRLKWKSKLLLRPWRVPRFIWGLH